MSSIYFVIKCTVVTFFVVLLLQVRVGSKTLEQHAVRFIYGSTVMEPLQQTAESATTATKRGLKQGSKFVSRKWNEIWENAKSQAEETSTEIIEN